MKRLMQFGVAVSAAVLAVKVYCHRVDYPREFKRERGALVRSTLRSLTQSSIAYNYLVKIY